MQIKGKKTMFEEETEESTVKVLDGIIKDIEEIRDKLKAGILHKGEIALAVCYASAKEHGGEEFVGRNNILGQAEATCHIVSTLIDDFLALQAGDYRGGSNAVN